MKALLSKMCRVIVVFATMTRLTWGQSSSFEEYYDDHEDMALSSSSSFNLNIADADEARDLQEASPGKRDEQKSHKKLLLFHVQNIGLFANLSYLRRRWLQN